MIGAHSVVRVRFITRVKHSTFLHHTPSFIADIEIMTPLRTVIRVNIDLRRILADFPCVCTSHSNTDIKAAHPPQLFKTTTFIVFSH